MKKGVKKGSAQSKGYAKQVENEKMLWTMKVLAYAQQEMLDTMAMAHAEYCGWGPERNKRFHDQFEEKYSEIRKLDREDSPDNEYTISVIEKALQAAYGKYYEPREVRYDIHMTDKDGNVWKL